MPIQPIATGDFQAVILIVGMMVTLLGFYLNSKQRAVAIGFAADAQNSDESKFERRQYRRRVSVARLMILLGLAISSCYWVRDGMVFAILLSIMLLLIFGITVLAYIDLASVGIKFSLDRLVEEDTEVELAIGEAIDKYREEEKLTESPTADEPNGDRE